MMPCKRRKLSEENCNYLKPSRIPVLGDEFCYYANLFQNSLSQKIIEHSQAARISTILNQTSYFALPTPEQIHEEVQNIQKIRISIEKVRRWIHNHLNQNLPPPNLDAYEDELEPVNSIYTKNCILYIFKSVEDILFYGEAQMSFKYLESINKLIITLKCIKTMYGQSMSINFLLTNAIGIYRIWVYIHFVAVVPEPNNLSPFKLVLKLANEDEAKKMYRFALRYLK